MDILPLDNFELTVIEEGDVKHVFLSPVSNEQRRVVLHVFDPSLLSSAKGPVELIENEINGNTSDGLGSLLTVKKCFESMSKPEEIHLNVDDLSVCLFKGNFEIAQWILDKFEIDKKDLQCLLEEVTENKMEKAMEFLTKNIDKQ